MRKKFIGISFFAFLLGCQTVGSTVKTDEAEPELISHFLCKQQGENRYKPYWMQAQEDEGGYKDWSQTPKGLLGQNAMKSEDECKAAIAASLPDQGVICSRTGLDGWKPTIYTGTRPGRADFGYLGGSSIMNFDDCLKATANASDTGVCYWGGSDWYVTRIDRSEYVAGPFGSIDECIEYTKPEEAELDPSNEVEAEESDG